LNEESGKQGFAIWITGLPSSGKSTISAELVRMLENARVRIARLESDQLRKVLTPSPDYSAEERDWFYRAMAFIGLLLIRNGVNVLFDATANKRIYRDDVRKSMKDFMEVYVKCPLAVCMERDVKGIYRRARKEQTTTVPGLQEQYEEPMSPDIVIESDKTGAADAAQVIFDRLCSKGWI
jgi:adenylylsulfate kinase